MVSYTYNAWGKVLSVTGSMASTLGRLNPLTYRGYVYDWETGLYYLQSRYYTPEWGRFINADNYPTTGQGFTGNNMYVYCGNNPVSRIDESGYFWLEAIVGAAVNVATTFIAAKVTGQSYTWADAGAAALSGACNAIPIVGPVISGAISGIYTGYTSYCNGASVGGAILCGTVSALATTCSISNLAGFQGSGLDLATTAVTDAVFGTGYNSMSAAVTKAVVDNSNSEVVGKKTTSALTVARRTTQIANTRIIDGNPVSVKRRASYVYYDEDRVYCYVQF